MLQRVIQWWLVVIHIIESCVYSDLLPPGGQRHSKGVFLCKALIGYPPPVILWLESYRGTSSSDMDKFVIYNFCKEKRSFKVYRAWFRERTRQKIYVMLTRKSSWKLIVPWLPTCSSFLLILRSYTGVDPHRFPPFYGNRLGNGT